ncbi:GH18 family chitinase [Pelomonas saccharophila]|uniref:chitinase n=1 Tax=Roseateles saccharophilus TaxID=304 RepID=A0ABU1YUB8_ROSSA|nr:glycosyl hydrolase family 18 protein [Roseateles saccharophilus]MDR7272463.1 GH18 family chitinase [Roseateles saccharophilus]
MSLLRPLAAALVMLGLAGTAFAQTKVVGYIPSYKGLRAVADRTDLAKLTHINLAFANPAPGGSFLNGGSPACMEAATGADISYVVQKAHAAGAKVLVSLAGGVIPACSGNWQTLLQPGTRATVVNNLVQFVNSFGLDGVDVDIEGALLTSIDNAGNYTPFIQALRAALPGKLVTAATATYEGGMIPTSSLASFDFVTLMAYDAVGPGWGTVGTEHSTYAMAQSHIATWQARGLPKSKLVLGLPFYGYGFNGYAANYSFADIVNQFGAAAAQSDLIGTACASCAYITYNGIPTIKAKTRLALQQGAGVMIWELSQDGTGANSLLSAVRAEIGSTPSGVATVYQDCNYGGYSAPLPEGSYTLSQLQSRGVRDNDLSSLRVNAGYQVQLFDGDNFSGSSVTRSGDTGCLVDQAFNDRASSVIVSKTTTAWSRQIEAENYSNQSGVQTEACSEGGLNVGWIDAGDWMAYANVNFPTSGSYRVEYRVASVNGARLSLDLNAGSIQLGQVNVPATGGWQTWTTVSHTVTINAGTYSVGIYAPAAGWNLNWIKFTKL